MTSRLGFFRAPFALVLGALFSLFACEGRETAKETGSETHFLLDCALGCGGLDCLCGVCTRACDSDASCTSLFSDASCIAPEDRSDQTCPGAEMAPICDVACTGDAACEPLGEGFACVSGHCRRPVTPTCERSDPTAAGVVLLGDVMLELTTFRTDLETLARTSGSLDANATFRNYALAAESFLAGTALTISGQYARATAEAPATLVIMDGGETDVLQEPCGTAPASDCAELQAAATAAETLLAQMATDGVGAVVYVYYAEPVDRPSVKAGLDVLRPMLESVCAAAPLPCHFVDLRPVFEGRYDEFVGTDGLVWSEAGAQATAGAVWDLMQAECLDW